MHANLAFLSVCNTRGSPHHFVLFCFVFFFVGGGGGCGNMFPASVADQNILFSDFSAYLISTHILGKS